MVDCKKRSVVTVDGLAASGKSALAAGLAARLGFGHLNSGLLYRAVAFLALEQGIALEDEGQVVSLLQSHSLGLELNAQAGTDVSIDGVVRNLDLSSEPISRGASIVSQYSGVRDYLTAVQRNAFLPHGVVAEGRDMGTVIFPDARVKFFVQACVDIRAERRYRQLVERGQSAVLDEIKREISERDERDTTRQVAPTKPADGAFIIDNSTGTLEATIERMFQVVRAAT